MTDLTGVLTSTGQPLRPGLQHNGAAQQEIHRRWAVRQHAHDEAVEAAANKALAEEHVESLHRRLNAAELHEQSWASAAATMPETVRSTAPSGGEMDKLRRDLTQAEQRLENATRVHAAASARYLAAHNDAAAFQHHVYSDYRDPIESD